MIKRRPVRFFLLAYGLPTVAAAVTLATLLDWNGWVSWVVSANAFAFLLWGFDKFQSKGDGWRVPELVLHIVATAGATPASLISMSILRHKTRKVGFAVLYSILLLFQLALVFTFAGRE